MNFFHRLKYYLLGVGLGILIVLSIFKDRNLASWTPKNQVLKHVSEYPMVLSERTKCQLNCLKMDPDSLQHLMTKASVEMDMDKSDQRRKGRYKLELENSIIRNAEIELSNDTCLVQILELSRPCDCR